MGESLFADIKCRDYFSKPNKLQLLHRKGYANNLAERLLKNEPDVVDYILSKKAFYSSDITVLDMHRVYNPFLNQESTHKNGLVTLYRGVNLGERDISTMTSDTTRGLLWATTDLGYAKSYAVGEGKSGPSASITGYVLTLKVPRFLVHWRNTYARYDDFDEAYLHVDNLIKDYRSFIVEIKQYWNKEDYKEEVIPLENLFEEWF